MAVNNTLVPEQIVPDGDDAIETLAVPDVVEDRESPPKFVPVLTPLIVPVTEEGFILPLAADVLVACTCNPLIVTWSISVLLVPAIVMLSEVDVNVPLVTLVIFLADRKDNVGLAAELNCHPVGGASTMVIVQLPAVLPMSALFPSLSVLVASVVHRGVAPVAA